MIDHTCRILSDVSVPANSRVDAFCVLTGNIEIGGFVHVASGCRLIGSGGLIRLHSGSFVSMGSTILTASDNYTTPTLIGPTIPEEYRNVRTGNVMFGPFSGVGAHTIVMPGVVLGFGSRVGANSLVTRSVPPGEIWAGTPAKKIGEIDLWKLKETVRCLPLE